MPCLPMTWRSDATAELVMFSRRLTLDLVLVQHRRGSFLGADAVLQAVSFHCTNGERFMANRPTRRGLRDLRLNPIAAGCLAFLFAGATYAQQAEPEQTEE